MAKFSRIACFMVVFAMVVNMMAEQGEALSCADLGASMKQCGTYLTGSAHEPSGGCCGSVKRMYGMTKTAQDRKVLCNCLKQSASSSSRVQPSRIVAMPQKCGVPVSMISADPNVNCNSIH